MKTTARFVIFAALMISLTVTVLGTTGCASTRNQQSTENQTMYDFIGGGKPEFNGQKY